MADHSESPRFLARFESALQDYQQTTGVTLAEHPLTMLLQNLHSAESIMTILKYEARASGDPLGSSGVMKSIERTVSMLFTLSATASFSASIGLPHPPPKVIFTGLAILFATTKDTNSNNDELVNLLESIERFLKRVDIYARTPPTPAMDEIVFDAIVSLLSVLALATRKLKRGRSIKFVKKAFGERRFKEVLQRLDQLTQDEARATAAQTLEVVHCLVQNMRVVMNNRNGSADHVQEALEILHRMEGDMNKSKRDKLRRDVQRWLSPPDPWKNHNIARGSWHSGSGTWFLQGDTFSEWKASGNFSLLWIHGIPGAGKSVLCSTIIEELETMRKSGLASLAIYYHDFRENQKQDPRGLLSSVLFQLCDQSDSYHDIISNFYSTHRDGEQSPSNEELAWCLKYLLKLPGQLPVYLVIDALDECPNTTGFPTPREEVLDLLEDLIAAKPTNLHMCVTSRPEIDIRTFLEPLVPLRVSLHDCKGQLEDIKHYIRYTVNTEPNIQRWKQEDKQLAIRVLTDHANGMFRWVNCQIVYLSGCNPGRIRHTLDYLPTTLDEIYECALQEIERTTRAYARRVFQFIAAASRPLHVEELAQILAFDSEASPVPQLREDWLPEDYVKGVLSICPVLLSLVDVNDSPVIQFSHSSVKEFLTSGHLASSSKDIYRYYHISMEPAHTLATRTCLDILLSLDENITREGLRKFPLAEYAAEHWLAHARFGDASQNVEEGMRQLFDPKKLHLAVWTWICDPNRSWRQRYRRAETLVPPFGTPLYYATFCGLHSIVKFLATERSQDLHSRDDDDESTLLHLASQRGHVEVARVLIDHGASVSAKDKDGWTPLHWASEWGHLDLARFLVEHGADVSAKDKDGSTGLHWAAASDRIYIARFLVERGADVSAMDKDGWTPLHWASRWGRLVLATFLVEHRADVSAENSDGSTALHWAAASDCMDLAQFLVRHGADVSAKNKDGWTPLHWASGRGHVDLARFLVENGANVSAKDKDRLTPMHRAWRRGCLDLMRFLVEHGADVFSMGEHGMTLLHWASRRGHVDLAWALIEHGADVSAKDEHDSTALHRASSSGSVKLSRLLVENGADVSAMNGEGSTPLHQASSRGHVELTQFFVEHDANVSAKDRHGSTPLHLALRGGHLYLAHFLVEHDADVSIEGEYGSTPLHLASRRGYVDLTRSLVEHGADVSARDKYGSTPLHWALRRGHIELARFLIEHGADVSAKDKHRSTPLRLALRGGHVDLAWLLVEHGADVPVRSTPYIQQPNCTVT